MIISRVLGLIVGDGKYYTNSNVSMNYLSRSWNFIDAVDIGLMIISALCGFIGTVFLINAYRIGDPSRITVLEYSGLIPTINTWIGILIIIGCGLYLFYRENSIPDKSPQEINYLNYN